MNIDVLILMLEAVAVYLLVLGAHALRSRFGLGPFYAVMGGITAVMSWVTDAGVVVKAAGITFMVGSTVFYTALLLGAFVVYVFDGPRNTRIAILTIAGVSVVVPVIAAVLDLQLRLSGQAAPAFIPAPSLRINTASVLATMADLVFLAMAWEFLGRVELGLKTWLRAFLTLLGVMWLDVVLFATGAFAGTPMYLSVMTGTLLSRLVITCFACPFLYAYLNWQYREHGSVFENRPVLSILRAVEVARAELNVAQQEIERRKQAEEEAREGQAFSQTLIESIPGTFYMVGANGRYLAWNAYQRDVVLGCAEDQLNKVQALDTIHPDDRSLVSSKIANVLQNGAEEIVESRVLLRGGPDFRWFLMTGRRLMIKGDPVLIGTGIDITDLKQLEAEKDKVEAQYQQLQKTESLSRMAGAIAHNFNNQLQALLGNLELALYAQNQGLGAGEKLVNAIKAANKASELSGLMLTYLGQTPGKHQPLDLSEAFRRSLPAFRETMPKEVTLETDLPSSGPVIKSTSRQIQLILSNLLTNAWESLDGGAGVIHLALKTVVPAEIPVTHRFPVDWQPLEARYACVEVTDAGCGISEKALTTIFDPFFTTKFTGRGLGLSVVLGIVRAHGGLVTVESAPDRGSVFRVFLPVVADDKAVS